jgi:hypothetical protein|tara:strand:- start:117 stop:218 length:102 start_codon:yes stop_codon:yes gene_type:complete
MNKRPEGGFAMENGKAAFVIPAQAVRRARHERG